MKGESISVERSSRVIPESFRIIRVIERHDLGVLSGIYHHSMSLRNAVRDGVFPPLAVFNDFMACGVDDVDLGIAYFDIDKRNWTGAIIEWEPFALTQGEYDRLLEHIRSTGGDFEVVDIGIVGFSEWFTKCLKPRTGLR